MIGRARNFNGRPKVPRLLLVAALVSVLFWFQLAGCGWARAGDMTHWPVPETKEIVRTAQYLLRAYGNPTTVDGRFGAQTRRVLARFQNSHGLRADGVLGRKTLLAPVVRVKLGDKGGAVVGGAA